MKAAVYDRYWTTLGGGEQFAGGIAQALAERDGVEVDVIGPEVVDVERMRERLGVDLGRTTMRVVGPDERAVTAASFDYDLFVNCTYLSAAPNGARTGLYVAHFPGVPPSRLRHWRGLGADAALRWLPRPLVRWRSGAHQAELDGTQRWTDGLARLDVANHRGETIRLVLSTEHWPAGSDPVRVRVRCDRHRALDAMVPQGERVPVEVVPGDPRRTAVVLVESDSFSPVEVLGVPDVRRLGVLVLDVAVGTHRLGVGDPDAALAARLLPADAPAFVSTYDRVAANSPFTQRWIDRLWSVHSDVLYPPVRMHGPGAGGPSGPESKERMILSIGRFFGAASGHSKKQVELVRAFRRLVGTGLDGWRLVLVGGCDAEHRDYAMQVRREAAGLPVEVRFNAPGSVVQDLLGRAALYWHGAGWGEDEDAHPDRMEHFGIAVVEAMSAGAVPLVFGAAGPAEVVVDGVSGRHFRTEAELVARTRELVDDEALRRRFADAAVARAREFAWDRFTTRLWQLVDDATVSPARPAPR